MSTPNAVGVLENAVIQVLKAVEALDVASADFDSVHDTEMGRVCNDLAGGLWRKLQVRFPNVIKNLEKN